MIPTAPQQPCGEHIKLVREQAELHVLVRAHADSTRQSLDRILDLLQGQGGDGLTDRVTRLETRVVQTDDNIERLAIAIQGANGDGGVVGRMGKLERAWAMLIGIAIASGAAGAGFAKLLSLIGS